MPYAVKAMISTPTQSGARLVTNDYGTPYVFQREHFASQLKARMIRQRKLANIEQQFEVVEITKMGWLSPRAGQPAPTVAELLAQIRRATK